MGYGYQQSFHESVTTVTATGSVALGTRRIYNLTEYLYVYNGSTSTIGVGYGVVASAQSAGTVTVSSVTGDMCLGVAQTQIEPNYYGWVAVRGPATIEIGDTVIGDHTAVTGVGVALMSDGAFYGIAEGSSGTGTTWGHTVCGVTVESIGTNQSGTAILNCITYGG